MVSSHILLLFCGTCIKRNIDNIQELRSVINEYLSRGFGSMNKNDFEVWIFNYLLQERLKGKSNYDISIELKIPEQKVKRLKI